MFKAMAFVQKFNPNVKLSLAKKEKYDILNMNFGRFCDDTRQF